MDSGYPQSIEENFPGMDDEVDAAAYHDGIMMLQISVYNDIVDKVTWFTILLSLTVV